MTEKRQFRRTPVDVPVLITLEGAQDKTPGRCRDMSIGGVFVETELKAAFGARLKLTVTAPGGDMEFPAVVRWTAADGLGLQFQGLGARETHAIVQWVSTKK
ncbi:MAG: PilZ domain-containing protein [Deltaproteobacteria bacterium]|nr:PilZ domain-containing protein [Deltaproteobacteria bacterium]